MFPVEIKQDCDHVFTRFDSIISMCIPKLHSTVICYDDAV